MEPKDLRRIARENLAGMWPLAIAVAAVASLLGGIGMSFLPDIEYSLTGKEIFHISENLRVSLKSGIFGFLAFILGGTLELGYCQFLLKQYDKQNPEFNDLFSQFHRFGTGFAQQFLRGLYIFLWALLLVVPGIIAAYRYAMTPYILADHPEMTASEAIEQSKRIMDGHKGELFVLDLSFVGWNILAGLCWNLGFLFVNPYLNAAKTAFYRKLISQQAAQGSYTAEM